MGFEAITLGGEVSVAVVVFAFSTTFFRSGSGEDVTGVDSEAAFVFFFVAFFSLSKIAAGTAVLKD